MELQLYAKLGVVLDGRWLLEQCGVAIHDHVNRPCRIVIESVLPESGLEVNARRKLGDIVNVAVHLVSRPGQLGLEVLSMRGAIIACTIRQPTETAMAVEEFVIEHRPETPATEAPTEAPPPEQGA